MLLRLIYVPNVFEGRTTYTDIYSKKICRLYGKSTNYGLFTKTKLLEKPLIMAIALMGISTCVLAFILQLVELPYQLLVDSRSLNNYS